MSKKDKTLTYAPKKVISLIKSIPLNKSKLTVPIKLYFSKNVTLFPKKPVIIIFSCSFPKNALSNFQNASLSLSKKLKNLGIYH